MYDFPIAITNYHKHGGSKEHKFIISQFYRLASGHNVPGSSAQHLTGMNAIKVSAEVLVLI